MTLNWDAFQILGIVRVIAMKRSQRDLTSGPLLSGIITYTVPIILTSVLQLLFNAADLVVVGRFRGSLSVGAVGATGALTNLIVNLFVGLSVGAGVCVAHAIGAKQEKILHRIIHTAVFVAIFGGAALTVVGVSLSSTFLRWMDTPADILPLSTAYMRIYFCGMAFIMVYNFCASILRAAGDTKGPLLYLSLAGVVNVVLNLFFVVVLGMNVEGVALATIISQALAAVLVVRALMRRTDGCQLDLGQILPHKAQLLRILRIGIPAGIQSSLFAISNVLIQSSVNSFGDVVVSGTAAAGNLEGFVYVTLNAFSQTAVNFTGQNVGAGQYSRVKKVVVLCCICATVVGILMGGGVYLAAPQLLKIYITDSAEAISYGVLRMGFVCLPYFLCGIMEVATGALRGMGASVTPMVISVLGVCGIRLGWIYTIFRIPQFHTLESLYVSYPISWTVTFVIEMVAFFIVFHRHVKRARENPLGKL